MILKGARARRLQALAGARVLYQRFGQEAGLVHQVKVPGRATSRTAA